MYASQTRHFRSLFATFCSDEADIEARCVLAFSLAISSHFIAADHGKYSRAKALKLALGQLLR
jgi:hypothetical protein